MCLAHPARSTFGNHQGRAAGIARGNGGHDRGVGDAQPGKAAQSEAGVDYGVGIGSHAAGAHRMEDRGADAGGSRKQVLIGMQAGAGSEFPRFKVCQSRAVDDASRQAQRSHGHIAVGRMTQVVGPDQRRVARIGRVQPDFAATVWAQVTDRRGKGIEAVQRFTKAIKRLGLDVVLQVGALHGQ